jgi:LysM repeat protein
MHPTEPIAAKPFAAGPPKPFAAVLLTVFLACSCLAGSCQAALADAPAGRAYLFRGLIGLIDWGMDELAGRITRTGVAANIGSHLEWRSVADQAIADYKRDPKPISVVGHSAGGDAAIEFAAALGAARVPVALLITYDPNRSAGTVPANVERYIDLYQSSNFLGGGDLAPGHGFHGHYAAFNLKDRPEIIHVNMDKFPGIQEQLAAKIRSAGARGEGEAVPLNIVFPSTGPIELWDSGMPVTAHAGDTLQTLAATYHVPLWALTQINQKSENAALTEGQRIVVPRNLGQRFAPRPGASPAKDSAPNPAANSEPSSASNPAPTPNPAVSSAPSPAPDAAPSTAPSDAPITR